jgi:hypothetical protein
MQFLGSHNVSEVVACHIETHPLPRHKDMSARVRQIPVGHIDRLFGVAGKEGPDGEKARLELIQRSIVNEDGTPVFTEESAQALMEGNNPIFLDLIDVISAANNKKKAAIEKEADAAEKK